MNIELFETDRGSCPVADFLQNLEHKTHKKIQRDLELIQMLNPGQIIRMGMLKKMTGSEKYRLFEYKLSSDKEYRILCCLKGETCYLVHAFVKKEKKTRQKHLNTAINRIINRNYHI